MKEHVHRVRIERDHSLARILAWRRRETNMTKVNAPCAAPAEPEITSSSTHTPRSSLHSKITTGSSIRRQRARTSSPASSAPRRRPRSAPRSADLRAHPRRVFSYGVHSPSQGWKCLCESSRSYSAEVHSCRPQAFFVVEASHNKTKGSRNRLLFSMANLPATGWYHHSERYP